MEGCEGMPDKPRRIALWGYGRYGKCLFEAIRKNWSSRITIVEVFDSAIGAGEETVLEGGIPLLSPEHALEDYRAGRFEALLISISNAGIHAQAAREVKALGIPTTTLVSRDDYHPFEEFEGAVAHEYPYGYTIHEYRGLYGFYHPLSKGVTQPFLFDGDGRGVPDLWYRSFSNAEPSIWNPARPFDPHGAEITPMEGEYFLGIGLWFKNLWHFTHQTLDKIMAMERAGFEGRYLLARAGFTEPLLKLLGLDLGRVVWLDELDPDALYRFEKVFAAELPKHYESQDSVAALLDVGKIVCQNVGDSDRVYPSRLYVKRIGTRRLVGSDEVLEHYGFTTMVPEDYTFEEQIRFFKHADIIVSPHGAALTNTLYMKPGSVLIEAFSNSWIAPVFTDVLRAKGVRYLPVVEATDLTRAVVPENVSDFSVNNIILTMVIEAAIQLVGQELPS